MPRGSKPGERRGGRKRGTPNKLPKGERALVKLDQAEAEVRALKAEDQPLDTLGKDRLRELDEWAHAMAKQFAPKEDDKGRLYWDNPGDEQRFLRFFKLSGEYAAARAPYESPRLAAIAAANIGNRDDDDGEDPYENLQRIIEGWIEADKAEKAERMIDVTPAVEPVVVEAKPNPDDEGIDGEMA